MHLSTQWNGYEYPKSYANVKLAALYKLVGWYECTKWPDLVLLSTTNNKIHVHTHKPKLVFDAWTSRGLQTVWLCVCACAWECVHQNEI